MFRVICLGRKKNQEIGNDGAAEQYRGRCRKTINKQKGGWSKSLFESHLVKRLLSVQIQSTKLTKFVTLHKTSPRGLDIFWKATEYLEHVCSVNWKSTQRPWKVISCLERKYWTLQKAEIHFCGKLLGGWGVSHNFENPIKMSHHIRFSPRQRFAWNGWTLCGSDATKGGCCPTKL